MDAEAQSGMGVSAHPGAEETVHEVLAYKYPVHMAGYGEREVDDMEFSIILPCYNVTTYLGKCLGSLRENDLRNTEVILVNDGSTDDFKGWCSDYFSLSKDYKWTDDITIEMRGRPSENYP